MNIKNLKFHEWYVISVDDCILKARYEGKDIFFNEDDYMFMYYSFDDNEFFCKHLGEDEVSKLVYEISLNYPSRYNSIKGFKRWLTELIFLNKKMKIDIATYATIE